MRIGFSARILLASFLAASPAVAEPEGRSRSRPEPIPAEVQAGAQRIMDATGRMGGRPRAGTPRGELRGVVRSLHRYVAAAESGDDAEALADLGARRDRLAQALAPGAGRAASQPALSTGIRQRFDRLVTRLDEVLAQPDPASRAARARSLLTVLRFQDMRRQFANPERRPSAYGEPPPGGLTP